MSLKGTLVLILVSVCGFAADPTLLSMVPSDAKVVAGIHVDRSAASPFGQFLLRQMQQDDAGFKKFTTSTGFDPRRDLIEVITASPDGPQHSGHGVILARGNFDVARITSAAKAEGKALTTYQNAQVVSTGSGPTEWIAFPDGGTAIIGDQDSVKTAINRRRSGGAALDFKIANKVQDLSAKYDAWIVSTSPVSDFAGKMPNAQVNGAMNGDMMKSIELATGGIQFGSNIQIVAEAVTRSDKDASALVDVVKFLAGMIQLNRDRSEVANFAALLDTMELKAVGTSMTMSLTVPEVNLEKMLKPQQRPAVRRVVYTR